MNYFDKTTSSKSELIRSLKYIVITRIFSIFIYNYQNTLDEDEKAIVGYPYTISSFTL